MCDHLFVVTGGPGAGKSALIEALSRRGVCSMPEAGRAIIREQVAIGGAALPWGDRALYAELMLGWELRSFHEAEAMAALPGSARFIVSRTGAARMPPVRLVWHS